MHLLSTDDRRFLKSLSELGHCNPFLPERMELEHEVLGEDFQPQPLVWSRPDNVHQERPNIQRLMERVESIATSLRERLLGGATANEADLTLYEDLVLFVLYHRVRTPLQQLVAAAMEEPSQVKRIDCWKSFHDGFRHFLELPGRTFPTAGDAAHLFAGFFQIRRAFDRIFHYIVGGSMPAARLRAAVWQSIFTHDMRRYRRSLYRSMGDCTTLITGQTGTGKELVARAIGLSRYIPFDPEKERFIADFAGSFRALNLSALSPTLIESELFGHRRGAFTGATGDRVGWLEVCPPLGTVFLDEVGELDPAIQVKLLRVLQSRTFQRLGDTEDLSFHGKIIAATNRNLAAQMQSGRFREDFYYRLCSDLIHAPTLREQLADSPEDLHKLVLFIAKRIVPAEAEALAAEVESWINTHLGMDYSWPGNIRELEQCVRNVMIRKAYHPSAMVPGDAGSDPMVTMTGALRRGELTANELLSAYCTVVYAQVGSYEEAARRLQLDRRTVKSKVDPALLKRLRGKSASGRETD